MPYIGRQLTQGNFIKLTIYSHSLMNEDDFSLTAGGQTYVQDLEMHCWYH